MKSGDAVKCNIDLPYYDSKGEKRVLKAGLLLTFKMWLGGKAVLSYGNKIFVVSGKNIVK